MKKNTVLENVRIDKLVFGGKGLAVHPDGRKIMVSGGAIPGQTVNLRILKSKKNYLEAQIQGIVAKSPFEGDLPAHYQVYGGCKWLPIRYDKQLEIKDDQVKDALRILRDKLENTVFHPIVASPEIYGYRNKVEFSWGKYISDREGVRDEFRFGFHKQGEFDRIVDCDYCVLADDRINEIFAAVRDYSRDSGIPTYDPKTQIGFWRHFVVRKSKSTGATMLVFSANTDYEGFTRKEEGELLVFVRQTLVPKFPEIESAYLLRNTGKADIVTGEAVKIHGSDTIVENLLGLEFEIHPKSFFQTNSLGAEKLYETALSLMKGQGGTLLDLYAGTGTIGILLAKRFDTVHSVELVPEASADGKRNAARNGVKNVEFFAGKAEDFVKAFLASGKKADAIMIDPPRDGMHPDAPKTILEFKAKEIVYVSCNPATLARDLVVLLESGEYRLTDVVAVDMFPHTHHIETVARLERVS
ncbi:MAG: TrmA [Patescibacteria group bacterium]|nr:TrmA [Patescibacteria group bacterium]